MSEFDTFYAATRETWRLWLKNNYKTAPDIWLVYPRKHTGIPRILYNDAVEEALCFGWIDSITKGIDEERYCQRFSPRKTRSNYSQTNRERLSRLISQGRVMPEVLATVGSLVDEEFLFPEDILAALRANKKAWDHFQRYSGSYQRIRVAYVDGARKRPEEFEKRLRHLLQKTEQGKQFGFGIESYY